MTQSVRPQCVCVCVCVVQSVSVCPADTSLCSEDRGRFLLARWKTSGRLPDLVWVPGDCRRPWQSCVGRIMWVVKAGKQRREQSSCEVTSNSNGVKNVCRPDIIKGDDFLMNWHENGFIKRNQLYSTKKVLRRRQRHKESFIFIFLVSCFSLPLFYSPGRLMGVVFVC